MRSYQLSNSGITLSLLDHGATITSLTVPDRHGQPDDVVLGFLHTEDYRANTPYFGSVVGRCANRISDGQFHLDGTLYQLTQNDGPNHIHGGAKGFDQAVWSLKETDGQSFVELAYDSPDGEEGYPGLLKAKSRITLTEDQVVRIEYWATTDRPTLCNLTNHSYFNLSGVGGPSVLDHHVKLNADHYTPIDARKVPTGEIEPLGGGPLDLREGAFLRDVIHQDHPQLTLGHGFDFNYVVNGPKGALNRGAIVEDPHSGRMMEVWTNQPGLQLYTGNFLDESLKGKGGHPYGPHAGLCLEAQTFPNAIQHDHFPSPILRPGDLYHHVTEYRFSLIHES